MSFNYFQIIKSYFFTVCWNTVVRVAKHAHQKDSPFCINLSALFLSEYYKKEFIHILPYVDILFGNDEVKFTVFF